MIYLLRHGETVWNREGRIQGRRDSPLTRAGIAQAEAMGRTLRGEIGGDPRAWAIVASPLGRAWQSAAIVAEILGLAPEAIAREPRLAEMGFGAWEGLTYQEVEAAEPGAVARRARDQWQFRPPGGESYADLSARVAPWVAALEDRAKLIAVCHGGTGRALRQRYAGLSRDAALELSIDQNEIYRLHDAKIEIMKTNHGANAGATL